MIPIALHFFFFCLLLLCLLPLTSKAHMQLLHPPPLNSKFNPTTPPSQIDYDMPSPLLSTGADFPCKNYHRQLIPSQPLSPSQSSPSTSSTTATANDPSVATYSSVATYIPGKTYNITLSGTATHQGGSCQISLSFDMGMSWRVVKSIVGACPLRDSYDFEVPVGVGNGVGTGKGVGMGMGTGKGKDVGIKALLAWSWFNKVGNREMYMNCALVTILQDDAEKKEEKPISRVRRLEKDGRDEKERGGGGGGEEGRRVVGNKRGIDDLPRMFEANIGNKSPCTTIEGEELIFPDPGEAREFGAGVTDRDLFDERVCAGDGSRVGQDGIEGAASGSAAAAAVASSSTFSSLGPSTSSSSTLTQSSDIAAVLTTLQTVARAGNSAARTSSSIPSPSSLSSSHPSPPPSSSAPPSFPPQAPSQPEQQSSSPSPSPPSEPYDAPLLYYPPLPTSSTSISGESTSSSSGAKDISCIPNSLHCLSPFTIALCSASADSYLALGAVAPGTICVSSAEGDRIVRAG